MISSLQSSFETIQSRLAKTSQTSDLSNKTPSLIAVSKRQPQEKIQAALDIGHRIFGENMVQEGKTHWADLKSRYDDLALHLIGPLQSNKVKDAVALFDVIHTIDRLKIADAVKNESVKQGREPHCLIQINTGEETQKHGIFPKELEGLMCHCESIGLAISGLMCIPPADDLPAPHFALLYKLAQEYGLPELSMGMSADYEVATQLGATYVRIGTGVFGERAK